VSDKLPKPWPKLPDDPRELLAWASDATEHEVTGTYRPSVGEHAGIVLELVGGHELFFETITEACRTERFIAAFMSIDGVVMTQWTAPEIKQIVGALVRAARLGKDRDEREVYADMGERYLTGCLSHGGRIGRRMGDPLGLYRGTLALKLATRHLRGDEGEPWPAILHAEDLEQLYVVRGLFLSHSKRVVGRMNTAALNQQMRRVGWQTLEANPRKPGDDRAPRPHMRLWQIPVGWEGVTPTGTEPAPEDLGDVDGPAVPDGPGSRTRGRAGASSAIDHAGPRDQARRTGRRP
jgi:hypothetical protein